MDTDVGVLQRETNSEKKVCGRAKRAIGIVSAERSAGRSFITALLAVKATRRGAQAAILDADTENPSIRGMFGVTQNPDGLSVFPVDSGGIQIVTVRALPEDAPGFTAQSLQGTIDHCLSGVFWADDTDLMLVDMPAGDGARTALRAVPLTGLLMVTSPQALVSKTVPGMCRLAKSHSVPLVGVVENMSYTFCPRCGDKISVFGESHIEETADRHGVRVLGRVPIDPRAAHLCELGKIRELAAQCLDEALDALLAL